MLLFAISGTMSSLRLGIEVMSIDKSIPSAFTASPACLIFVIKQETIIVTLCNSKHSDTSVPPPPPPHHPPPPIQAACIMGVCVVIVILSRLSSPNYMDGMQILMKG